MHYTHTHTHTRYCFHAQLTYVPLYDAGQDYGTAVYVKYTTVRETFCCILDISNWCIGATPVLHTANCSQKKTGVEGRHISV